VSLRIIGQVYCVLMTFPWFHDFKERSSVSSGCPTAVGEVFVIGVAKVTACLC
jgi:hypothetical protein